MSIVSVAFAIFLLVSLFAFYLAPKRFQWLVILASNVFFYFACGAASFVFILFSSLVTYFCSIVAAKYNGIVKEEKNRLDKEKFKLAKKSWQNKKRIVLVFMLAANIGILFYLKYWNVIVNSKTIFLPLGISYYTLQMIGYFMDVYNSKIEAERNYLKLFLFISFFPQLIMGPINRFSTVGKQLLEEKEFDFENIKHGVILFLYGAMKKYIIADMLFKPISNILDPNYENLPGGIILFGVLMYAIYQYADFSGGIDMVLGIAELFGIKMAQNFKQPYFSSSLSNFWQRWHISLGAWMRDYVFYPFAFIKPMQNLSKLCSSNLGRHLGRVLPACVANILVFILVGAWHGPELHFLIWGLYNGVVIALSDICSPLFAAVNKALKINDKSKAFHVFRVIRTFIIVNIGWYFDRIVSVKKAFEYLGRTFIKFGNVSTIFSKVYMKSVIGSVNEWQSCISLVLIGSLIVFVVSLLKENKVDVYSEIQKKNIVFRFMAYYIPLILIVVSLSFSAGDTGFMYAQY